MYTPIPIPVPKAERRWWAKHRVYPVVVDLDMDRLVARVGPREYRILEAGGGEYVAALAVGARFVEAGRFGEARVYRTVSIGAWRDVKALRAAFFNTDYRHVVAVRTPAGLVHAGPCARATGVELYAVRDEDLESRCLSCGEGFE